MTARTIAAIHVSGEFSDTLATIRCPHCGHQAVEAVGFTFIDGQLECGGCAAMLETPDEFEQVQKNSGRRPQASSAAGHKQQRRQSMAKDKVSAQDKKAEVIAKRLAKVGLTLREGTVVCVCPTCGQDVSVENKPLAAETR